MCVCTRALIPGRGSEKQCLPESEARKEEKAGTVASGGRRISKHGRCEVPFSSIEKSTDRCETDAPLVTCLQSDTSVTGGASPEAGFLSFPVSAIKYSVSFPRNQGAGPAPAESIYWHRAAVPSDPQSFRSSQHPHPVYCEQTHPGGSAWWVTGHLSCLSLGLGLPRTHCSDSSSSSGNCPFRCDLAPRLLPLNGVAPSLVVITREPTHLCGCPVCHHQSPREPFI